MKQRGAYLLPAVVDPGEHWVFCVYVPKHLDHLLAFWGSLDYLAKWVAWDVDAAHTAREVAAVWREANELTRASFNSGECEGGDLMAFIKIRRRPKPGAPWITQEKYDDEPDTAWRDAHIQPHWISSSIATPPVIPDVRAAARVADRIIRGVYQWSVDQILSMVALGVPKETAVNAMLGQLAPYVDDPAATREAISNTWDMVTDLPTPTANEYGSAADAGDCCTRYRDFWNKMTDLFQKHPEAFVDELAEMIEDGIEEGVDRVMGTISEIARQLGGKIHDFANGPGNGASGDEFFDQNCDWGFTWDFEVTPGEGWSPTFGLDWECPPATWVDGSGWQGTETCAGPGWIEAVIRIKFVPTWITQISISGASESELADQHLSADLIGENGTTPSYFHDGGSEDWHFDPSVALGTEWPVQVRVAVRGAPPSPVNMRKVIFTGRGYSPFAPPFTASPPF